MTRIFDALKKAEASRPHAPHPAAVTPLPAAATHPTGGARPLPHPRGAAEGWHVPQPLYGAVPMSEDVSREMSTLRVSLESSLPERSPRIVMFEGPQGGEGSTTVALQFAQVLARDAAIRPLVVEAHVRRPAFHADPSHRGAVLDPRLAGGEAAAGVAVNLLVLPAPEEARRLGLLQPAVLRDMLDSAGAGFDWVILDGPPVLDSPDATALATLADAVVVVLHAGHSKRPVATRAVELLRKAGARVAGSVLNRRVHEIPEFIYRRL